MPLSTRYGFADAPTSAIKGDSSLGWTTLASTIAAGAASGTFSVASSAGFPAAVQFDIDLGLRDGTTGLWSSMDTLHITVVSGTTWTWTRTDTTLAHAIGESVSHVTTALGLTHNPQALTDAGDLPYLNASGRMDRLAAPSDGDYALRWTSAVPSYVAVSGGGLTFPDLATPPSDTALGSSAAPFGAVTANTLSLRTVAVPGTYTLANSGIVMVNGTGDEIFRLWGTDPDDNNWNSENLYIGQLAGFSQPTDNVSAGFRNLGICREALYSVTTGYDNYAIGYLSLHNLTTGSGNQAYGYSTLRSVTTGENNTANGNSAGYYLTTGSHNTLMGATAGLYLTTGTGNALFGEAAGHKADPATDNDRSSTDTDMVLIGRNAARTAAGSVTDGIAIGADATVLASHHAVIGSVTVTDVYCGSEAATATLHAAAFTLSGGGTLATQTYVNSQGFVTASSATAFSNKSGNISQWTNDSGYTTPGAVVTYVASLNYTTLAAVAGVGYVLGTRTVNGHALSSDVTVTASDLSLGSVENAAASGLYVPLARTVNGHALSANVSVTASDLSLGSVENTALSTWAGTTNVTTLGTVTSGTWNATAIAANKGGTGQTVYVVGDLLQASTTSALSTLAAVATGNVLIAGGVGTISAWGKVTTSHFSSAAVSQWTNDASYTTLAAVAGVGYLTSVTAHNVLSATHGDALADAVVRGDLLYGNSTPKWARLAKPSVLSGLSHDGTDVSWVTATGTGAPVRAAGATLTTPALGVATATSLNGNTFTAGTYTLSGAAGKTLTFNQSITLIGTDAQSYTFPTTSAALARTDAANTFTGVQTMTSPVLTTPAITTSATVTTTNIGAVSTDGLVLVNAQAALTGAQQWSPRLRLSGQGFKSNSVTASQAVDFITEVVPVQGATVATGMLTTSASVAGGAYVTVQTIDTGGNLQFTALIGGYGGNRYFASNSSGTAVKNDGYFGWGTSNAVGAIDTFLLRGGSAAIVQHGQDVNGAAISQTIQACNGITGQNRTGGNLTLASGKGTDLGAVSSLIFQTPTVGGATNGTAQSLATRLTITSTTFTLAEALDEVYGTTTGTKHGTATSQKQSWWNATPIIQPVGAGQAAYTDSTGGIAAASLVDVTTAAVSDPLKVNANFATVSVLLLAMRTALVNTGLMKGAA